MGFKFASFGAATVPLSKIIIDKELDMGHYPIKAVYRPENWATETLDWGDKPPEELYRGQQTWEPYEPGDRTLTTIESSVGLTRVTITLNTTARLNEIKIKVNGEVVATHGLMSGYTATLGPVLVQGGDVVSIFAEVYELSTAVTNITIMSDGVTYGDRTFDLTGKWLALGIDMKGLDATVKIHGVEVPYSDYAKYFPIAPTEVTIPGEWNSVEERPEIRVYKWQ